MVKKDSEEQPDYPRAAAAGAGALVGGVVAGPPDIAAGAALGVLLEPLARKVWDELTADGQRRAGAALAAACEAGIPQDELGERVGASERTRLLAGYALSAATSTAWEDKVRTLGRSLAAGLLASDDAKVDTEQLMIAAIADIEAPQLSLLEFLVCWEPGRYVGRPPIDGPLDVPAYSHGVPSGRWSVVNRAWTVGSVGRARPRLAPIVPSLLGMLQRHGLAVQNDISKKTVKKFQKELEKTLAEQYRQQTRAGGFRPSGIPRINSATWNNPQPTWSPTELGSRSISDSATRVPNYPTSGRSVLPMATVTRKPQATRRQASYQLSPASPSESRRRGVGEYRWPGPALTLG